MAFPESAEVQRRTRAVCVAVRAKFSMTQRGVGRVYSKRSHAQEGIKSEVITTTCLDSKSKEFTSDFPAEELSDYCGRERNVVWADVADPTSKDFDELAQEFGFHPLSIEDCRN